MLDTDICSYLMREASPGLLHKLQDAVENGHPICISVITYGELRLGAELSDAKVKYHRLTDEICERVDFIADWSDEQADRFAEIHARLLKAGQTIGANDAMIASHAMSIGAVLVTNNDRHFKRVDGLKYELWAEASG